MNSENKSGVKSHNSFPTFPSLGAAAGALGVPVPTLRQAKRLGAPGFPASGRVEAGPLLAWALTRGKTASPGRSLDQARARLADMQASKIERDEQLQRGNLVSVLWARDVVALHLERPRIWIAERIARLAFMLGTVAGITDPKRREDEIKRLLTADAKELAQMLANAEGRVHSSLAAGSPDGPGRTALGDLDAMAAEFVASVSPACQGEIRAHVAKLREQKETQAPLSAGHPEPEEPPTTGTTQS